MSLTDHLRATGWNETEAMNLLQDHGVVSDNCVTAADVAEADTEKAIG